ncbi:hypothetical protein D3C80_2045470 [compost metagenome]
MLHRQSREARLKIAGGKTKSYDLGDPAKHLVILRSKILCKATIIIVKLPEQKAIATDLSPKVCLDQMYEITQRTRYA